MQEKRRKAPGWLDSEVRVLEPERKVEREEVGNLMDEGTEGEKAEEVKRVREMDELGDQMDRAFGRSEMG